MRSSIYTLYENTRESRDFKIDSEVLERIFIAGFQESKREIMDAKGCSKESKKKYAAYYARVLELLVDKGHFGNGVTVKEFEKILELATNVKSFARTIKKLDAFVPNSQVEEAIKKAMVALSEFYDVSYITSKVLLENADVWCVQTRLDTIFDECLAVGRNESAKLVQNEFVRHDEETKEGLGRIKGKPDFSRERALKSAKSYIRGLVAVAKLAEEKYPRELIYFKEAENAISVILATYDMAIANGYSYAEAASYYNGATQKFGYKATDFSPPTHADQKKVKDEMTKLMATALKEVEKEMEIPKSVRASLSQLSR